MHVNVSLVDFRATVDTFNIGEGRGVLDRGDMMIEVSWRSLHRLIIVRASIGAIRIDAAVTLCWFGRGGAHLQMSWFEVLGAPGPEHLHHEEDYVRDVALHELVYKWGPLHLIKHRVDLICLRSNVLEYIIYFSCV